MYKTMPYRMRNGLTLLLQLKRKKNKKNFDFSHTLHKKAQPVGRAAIALKTSAKLRRRVTCFSIIPQKITVQASKFYKRDNLLKEEERLVFMAVATLHNNRAP